MKPIIGIITRPDELKSGNKVDVIYSSVRKAVIKFGGLPLVITPPTKTLYEGKQLENIEPLSKEEQEDLNLLLQCCDGFLFQGGDSFYNYDLYIVNYAYQNNIPSLGICLGMQLMAFSQNGILELLGNDDHHAKENYVHSVKIDRNSKLFSILGEEECLVNSRHYEHITKTDLPVVATASDGTIEAVEDPEKKFFIGVQWHPEDMIAYDKVTEKLWNHFILKCRECTDENEGSNQKKQRGFTQ